MSDDSGHKAARPHRASPWELGPQWIIAVATLVAAMTTAGFFAGQTVERSNSQNPTATTAAVASSAASVPSPAASPLPSIETSPSAPAIAPGTKIATYSFQIVRGYAVPLGDGAPKQADFVGYGTGGDIGFNGNYSSLVPMDASYKMIGLEATPATYQGCTTSSVFVGSVQIVIGKNFCLLKPGRIIGGKVVSAGTVAGQPVGIEITVWAAPAS
ncbi:hypothetical protein [Hamadaea tsunoensis]|uniref:hypothetical protein n=1 Tax=Hamadaea tsunoensis TaxID=53368 RepID=UPI0003F58E0D|nr:hypothetical protein [Hamadaea tsunoensis]